MNAPGARVALVAATFAALLAGCDRGSQPATNDPSAVMHLAESASVPIHVACRVRPDPAQRSAAAIVATIRNSAKKTIVGADLTVTDGGATSAFVPLSLGAGKSLVIRRSLATPARPSPHAACTLTMIQFADKSGWQYAPPLQAP